MLLCFPRLTLLGDGNRVALKKMAETNDRVSRVGEGNGGTTGRNGNNGT